MTESDLNKPFTVHAKNLRRILRNILARDHLQPKSRLLQQRQDGPHYHAKAMEMDWICDEKRARQPIPHSPSLDTRGEAETRANQEHLALNCIEGEPKTLYHTRGEAETGRRGAQDLLSHLGDRSEVGPEWTGVGYLFCRPICQLE